jgi:hypothetical protein
VDPDEVDVELALIPALRDERGPHAILGEPWLRLMWYQLFRSRELVAWADFDAALRSRLRPAAMRIAINELLARAPPLALQLAVLGGPTVAQLTDATAITVSSAQASPGSCAL